MTSTALNISLQSQQQVKDPDIWANIEQKPEEEEEDGSLYANFYDIHQMLTYSQSGLTAHGYNNDCNIGVDDESIAIPLVVDVWPSPLDLNYTLHVSDKDGRVINATISAQKRVDISRELVVIVPLSSSYSFDYLFDLSSLSWETPCFNKFGEPVPWPEYEVQGNKLVFDAEIFGVIRVRLQAKGYEHTVTLLYENSAADIADIRNTIAEQNVTTVHSAFGSYEVQSSADADTDVRVNVADISISVSYNGGTDSAEMDEQTASLQIPESIKNCLSQCPDGSLSGYGGSTHIEDDPENPADDPKEWTDVYYSACDGSILATNKRTVK